MTEIAGGIEAVLPEAEMKFPDWKYWRASRFFTQ
jgi:hypothetical protein